jgi:integrase/recombinase XerC
MYQDILTALENIFISFLERQKVSKKTIINYRMDIHHFFSYAKEKIPIITIQTSPQSLVKCIEHHQIEAYKQSQLDNNIPQATINRRLSTIRMFFKACDERGLLSVNPMLDISTIPKIQTKEQITDPVIREFERDLARDGASKVTIKNYAADVKRFLEWLENQ